MRVVDRCYMLIVSLGWLLIYCLVLRSFYAELRDEESVLVMAFAVTFLALPAAIITAVCVAIPLRIVMNGILRDRRRTHAIETSVLCLLLVAITGSMAGYIVFLWREHSRLSPPPGVTTLATFAASMTAPNKLQLARRNKSDYIVWTGDYAQFPVVPSGPSCYIFDEHGSLVDWQPETGDGGPVDELLKSSVDLRQVTLNEALRYVATRPAPADISR